MVTACGCKNWTVVSQYRRVLEERISNVRWKRRGRALLILMGPSKEGIEYLLHTASELKRGWRMKVPHEHLEGKTAAMFSM